jgi:hypothetical protein
MPVYRVTDYTDRKFVYLGSKPLVRKYMLDFPKHEIDVEEFPTTYKYQLVQLLNQTLEIRDVFGGVDNEDQG